MRRVALRLGAAILGLSALLLCLKVLRTVWDDEIFFAYRHVTPRLWPTIGNYGFVLICLTFFAAIAYLCFFYALGKTPPDNGAVGGSIAWASGAVLLASFVSQLLLVLIAGGVVIYRLPPELRAEAHLGWSPDLWYSTKSSPAFICFAVLLFALVYRSRFRRFTFRVSACDRCHC